MESKYDYEIRWNISDSNINCNLYWSIHFETANTGYLMRATVCRRTLHALHKRFSWADPVASLLAGNNRLIRNIGYEFKRQVFQSFCSFQLLAMLWYYPSRTDIPCTVSGKQAQCINPTLSKFSIAHESSSYHAIALHATQPSSPTTHSLNSFTLLFHIKISNRHNKTSKHQTIYLSGIIISPWASI